MPRSTPKEVMTPQHPRWEEFCERLAGPEGCNFKKGPTPETTTWNCAGGNDKTFATKILKAMNMDVEASLACFDEMGGHCDCEILFNVGA